MRALRFHAARDLRIEDIDAPPAARMVVHDHLVGIRRSDRQPARDPDRLVEMRERT